MSEKEQEHPYEYDVAAYQQYMLRGSAPTSEKKEKDTNVDDLASTTNDSTTILRKEVNRIEKRLHSLLAVFASVLEKEWMHWDDQLYHVISSIFNIRARLPVEQKQLMHQRTHEEEWKQYGFHTSQSYLVEEDLYKVVRHDLNQHEKYMAYVRKCLLKMSDAIQAASRHLDVAMNYQHQHMGTLQKYSHLLSDPDDNSSNVVPSFLLIHLACDVFCMLSKEMYRKQVLAQTKILITPDLLMTDTNNSSLSVGDSSQRCREWLRATNQSKNEEARLNVFFGKLKNQSAP